MAAEKTVFDRYRIVVRRGSMVRRLVRMGSQPPMKGSIVTIVDTDDQTVWSKPVASLTAARELVRLIETQVMTARLDDFEHWLRSEKASR